MTELFLLGSEDDPEKDSQQNPGRKGVSARTTFKSLNMNKPAVLTNSPERIEEQNQNSDLPGDKSDEKQMVPAQKNAIEAIAAAMGLNATECYKRNLEYQSKTVHLRSRETQSESQTPYGPQQNDWLNLR